MSNMEKIHSSTRSIPTQCLRMMKAALITIMISGCGDNAPPAASNTPSSGQGSSHPVVEINGRTLLLDGAPFLVKGITYAPVPIGQGPSEFLPADSRIYERDFPLLRASGANTIRTYAMIPSPDPGIVAAAKRHDLHLLLGFPLDPYYSTTTQPNQTLDPKTPTGRTLRARIREDFRGYVTRMCGSSQVLGFVAGNEVPHNYGAKFLGAARDFFTLLIELSAIPTSVCGRFLPVTTTMSDADLSDIGVTSLGTDDATSPLAFWSVNVFRGCTMGTVFSQFVARSTKPLLVSEFGIDAYNQLTGREDEGAQSACLRTLWDEIHTNATAATPRTIGSLVFASHDEYWKAGDPSQHDTGGFTNAAFPDGMMNEEYWGLLSVAPSATGSVDVVSPRAAFARLQQSWAGPVTITSPLGGTVRQTETISGTFADLRPGDRIFIVVRNRSGQLYPQSFPYAVSATTGTWNALAFFGDPSRNVGDSFQYFAVVSRDAALTNRLIAIGQTGGAATLPTSPYLISFGGQQTVAVIRQ